MLRALSIVSEISCCCWLSLSEAKPQTFIELWLHDSSVARAAHADSIFKSQLEGAHPAQQTCEAIGSHTTCPQHEEAEVYAPAHPWVALVGPGRPSAVGCDSTFPFLHPTY